MRALYLVSKCLPRVCMGGSLKSSSRCTAPMSAPRVHVWFHEPHRQNKDTQVCPACAWVVPLSLEKSLGDTGLPRVCMGGSHEIITPRCETLSAQRVHGWFPVRNLPIFAFLVCPACAWVVPSPVAVLQDTGYLPRMCMGGSGQY